MTTRLLFPLFIFFAFIRILPAQSDTINLIPNPGFEDVNVCTKYQEECFPEAWRSTTLKGFFFINDESIKNRENLAKEGHRYVSIGMYNAKRKFDRGFLQTPLLCELEAGKTYELSFYYKTPFRMLTQFGVIFKDTLLIQLKNDHLEGIQPNINIINKNFIPPNKWILVKERYKAKGGEKVLMIGNFNRDENTKVIQLTKSKKKAYDNTKNRTSYLFDDFKLIAVDTEVTCDIEKNRQLIYDDNVRHAIPTVKQKTDTTEVSDIEATEAEPEILMIEEDSINISETFELPNILFESNSDQLLPVAYPSLRKLANYLINNRVLEISITGHTDNEGTTIFNQSLSERRARSVYNYLIDQGVFKSRISYKGKGELEPIATNTTEEGKAQNRRVEFLLIAN